MSQRPLTVDPATPSEFHRRRAERELDRALSASSEDTALRHLALARLHHRQRAQSNQHRAAMGSAPIFRTDKEA